MSETVGQATGATEWRETDRRRVHRRLARQGKTVREIAEKTGASKSTVGRDITDLDPEPIAVTPGGANVYRLGRYNDDPDFTDRVSGLIQNMPQTNARRIAARELNATGYRIGDVCRRAFGSDKRIRTEAEKAHLLRVFDEANRGAAAA